MSLKLFVPVVHLDNEFGVCCWIKVVEERPEALLYLERLLDTANTYFVEVLVQVLQLALLFSLKEGQDMSPYALCHINTPATTLTCCRQDSLPDHIRNEFFPCVKANSILVLDFLNCLSFSVECPSFFVLNSVDKLIKFFHLYIRFLHIFHFKI